MQKLIHIATLQWRVTAMLACLLAWLPSVAQGPRITAHIDSASLLMGKTTTMRLVIEDDANRGGFLPIDRIDTLTSLVEYCWSSGRRHSAAG